jgi:hypothetical protein
MLLKKKLGRVFDFYNQNQGGDSNTHMNIPRDDRIVIGPNSTSHVDDDKTYISHTPLVVPDDIDRQ